MADNSKTASGAAAQASPAASPAARLKAAQGDRFARDFSQAIGVLMRDPNYKNLRIADLEWLLLPPLLAGQAKIAVSRMKADGPIVPVALALWARVSLSVDKRLADNLDKPPMLKPVEWKSGDTIWLIALVGNRQAINGLVGELQKKEFKDRQVKIRTQGKDGKASVQLLKITRPAEPARPA